MIEKIIISVIVGIVAVESIGNYEPIIKNACEVTHTYMQGVDYNRAQAELYGYKDVYIIDEEKRQQHNNFCDSYITK